MYVASGFLKACFVYLLSLAVTGEVRTIVDVRAANNARRSSRLCLRGSFRFCLCRLSRVRLTVTVVLTGLLVRMTAVGLCTATMRERERGVQEQRCCNAEDDSERYFHDREVMSQA